MMPQAATDVPIPARRPTQAAPVDQSLSPSPDPQVQSLVPPDDSRYQDPANVLFIDVLLGGMMPWVQAGVDLAIGRITEDQFDAARQEHQERINLLKQNNQTYVQAAEKALPFLTGLGIGIAKPVTGTVAAGTAVAGAQGFAQGFSSGPPEEPSFSGKRVGEGLGTAAITAPIGAAGAAVPKGVAGVRGALNRRADSKRVKQEEDAAAAKKRTSADKAARTRRMKQLDTEHTKSQAKRFESYTTAPEDFHAAWKENRDFFMNNTSATFADAAQRGRTVTDLARMTKLPEIVVAERIAASKPFAEGRAGSKLMREVQDIIKTKEAYRTVSSGKLTPKPRAKKAGK